jgi:hypothetical protein
MKNTFFLNFHTNVKVEFKMDKNMAATSSPSSSWTGTSEEGEGNGSETAEAKTRRYCCYGCVPLRLAVVGVLLAELLLIVQQVSFHFC